VKNHFTFPFFSLSKTKEQKKMELRRLWLVGLNFNAALLKLLLILGL
jgi:hypothetical protein